MEVNCRLKFGGSFTGDKYYPLIHNNTCIVSIKIGKVSYNDLYVISNRIEAPYSLMLMKNRTLRKIGKDLLIVPREIEHHGRVYSIDSPEISLRFVGGVNG